MSNETNRLALDELAAAATPPGSHQEGRPPDAAERLPAEVPPRPPAAGRSDDLGAVYDIPVQLSAVLGKTTMPVSQLLRLGRGAVVELDRKVGESIDILVNNRLVARGEVVILDDRLGVTMTEIIKTEQ
jgi:flagellar motor switch protein FliN/FliY